MSDGASKQVGSRADPVAAGRAPTHVRVQAWLRNR
jgi:hypothetical protein